MSLRRVTLAMTDPRQPDHPVMQEREAARRDLETHSLFAPLDDEGGLFDLALSIQEDRLVIQMTQAGGSAPSILVLSLKPYRKLISDYFMLVDSYTQVKATSDPYRLEAVDMGRRALHDEAAALLRERLADKISMDHATARRLFTLICALHLGKTRVASLMSA